VGKCSKFLFLAFLLDSLVNNKSTQLLEPQMARDDRKGKKEREKGRRSWKITADCPKGK